MAKKKKAKQISESHQCRFVNSYGSRCKNEVDAVQGLGTFCSFHLPSGPIKSALHSIGSTSGKAALSYFVKRALEFALKHAHEYLAVPPWFGRRFKTRFTGDGMPTTKHEMPEDHERKAAILEWIEAASRVKEEAERIQEENSVSEDFIASAATVLLEAKKRFKIALPFEE